jgi:exoribonuclease R
MTSISEQWNNLFKNTFQNVYKNIYSNIDNINLHPIYGINNRKDYKHLQIYSIDPKNCTDADDAFSIWEENNLIHLMIHIADPTCWFGPDDKIFDDILNNGTTIYLSGNEPNHLFPHIILENSTLTHGIRNVIIVHTILNPVLNVNGLFSVVESNIEFGIIDCNNQIRLTYEEAANKMFSDVTLLLGMEIARSFWQKRQPNNQNTFIFSELNLTIPIIESNEIILKTEAKRVQAMKSLIGEFAIHANTIFAQGLNTDALFVRELKLPQEYKTNNNTIDVLHKLMQQNISASYTNQNINHDMIGNIYTHATSPLRRTSDCIVHFLLKAKYLEINCPFNEEQLKSMAEKLTNKSKIIKNINFKDIKFRTFQWIAEELDSRLNPIKIKVKFISYQSPFVNLIITEIDDMIVNIPYTLRRNKFLLNITNIEVNITKINLYNKFDEGTLPQLDELI